MIAEDVEQLRRAFDRVSSFADFQPGERIWWIYLRVAVEHWLERHEDPAIRSAHNGVKAFPENLPDERARWLDLRMAVAQTLNCSS